jgi:hypothetical protein
VVDVLDVKLLNDNVVSFKLRMHRMKSTSFVYIIGSDRNISSKLR